MNHVSSLLKNHPWPDLRTRKILWHSTTLRIACVPHHMQPTGHQTDSGDPFVLIRIDDNENNTCLIETTAHLFVMEAMKLAAHHGILASELKQLGLPSGDIDSNQKILTKGPRLAIDPSR
jgi:hypothetical protein